MDKLVESLGITDLVARGLAGVRPGTSDAHRVGRGTGGVAPQLARHDLATVLLGLALTLALGGDTCSDLAAVCAEPAVFGPVASDPSLSRTIARLARDVDKALAPAEIGCTRSTSPEVRTPYLPRSEA